MPRRRELPCDPSEGVFCATDCAPPSSHFVALMEAAPGDPIPVSQEALLPLRDVIQDAMDRALDDRERWIFDATVVERKSLRAVGRELSLGKSQVHRIQKEAVRKLRDALRTEPMIKQYLRGEM